MADLKKAAKKVRQAGKDYAGSDTILAHIEAPEAMQLLLQGGSGEIDPKTGLPHFAQDKDSEHSGSRGSDSDGDDGGGDGDTDSGGESGGGGIGDGIGRVVGEMVRESVKGALTSPERRGEGLNKREAQLKSFGTDENLDQRLLDAQDPTMTDTETHVTPGIKGLVTGGMSLLGGNLPGAIAGGASAIKDAKVTKELVNRAPEGASDFSSPQRELGEHDGGNDRTVQVATKPKASTTTSTPESETTVAGDVDSFVRGARKKKGLQSTIVSGGFGGSGITTGKSLLGM